MNSTSFSLHACRVSALAAELALRAGLSRADQEIAAAASLLVDQPKERLNFQYVARLFVDRDPAIDRRLFPRYVLRLIAAVHDADLSLGLHPREPVADIIASADSIVRASTPNLDAGEDTREPLLNWFRRRRQEGLHSRRAYDAFAGLPRMSRASLIENASRAAVYPAVALRALRISMGEESTCRELALLAEQDQALAGHLLAAANCALNPTLSRIATVRHAVAYIGFERARGVVMAAAMRPMFASRSLFRLWRHSLAAASFCDSLARRAGLFHPDEAFLCGLVHDIGRLAMLAGSGDAPEVTDRLLARGCDARFAESVLFGCGHGPLGSEILERWRFPEGIIAGVAGHHRVRRDGSRHAAMLCLAESACADEEANPTASEQQDAAVCLGIGDGWSGDAAPDLGLLSSLTFAA